MSRSSASSNRLTKACLSRSFAALAASVSLPFNKWGSRFGGMELSAAAKLRELEADNNKHKKRLAELI